MSKATNCSSIYCDRMLDAMQRAISVAALSKMWLINTTEHHMATGSGRSDGCVIIAWSKQTKQSNRQSELRKGVQLTKAPKIFHSHNVTCVNKVFTTKIRTSSSAGSITTVKACILCWDSYQINEWINKWAKNKKSINDMNLEQMNANNTYRGM